MSVPLSHVIDLARKHSAYLDDDPHVIEHESRFFWVEALDELDIPFSCWDTSDTPNTIPPEISDQISGQTVDGYPIVVAIDGIPFIVWGSLMDLPQGSVIPEINEDSGVVGIVALEHIDCTR